MHWVARHHFRPSSAARFHRTVRAFDVVVTAAIFEELIKKTRWSELVQWSTEPPLHTRFHFGKYRGQRYADIAVSDPRVSAVGCREIRAGRRRSSTARVTGSG